MKVQAIHEIRNRLWKDGLDYEVPYQRFAREIARYVGIDKYKIKYTIQTLEELGYIKTSQHTVKFTNDLIDEMDRIDEDLRKEAEERMKRLEEAKAV
ncbi:hypothetical protein DRN85_06095 [Methanosarcinales archaeon]|nr:MAG: hypothetical protein DRN85_06095 [Methanosarcinales archaeon]